MMMRMRFDSGSTLSPLRVQFAREWTQIGFWFQFEYTFLKSVTLNTLDLQFARILKVDSDAPAAYMFGGGPPLPRQETSALCVGQRRRPGLEAGAHTRTAPATLLPRQRRQCDQHPPDTPNNIVFAGRTRCGARYPCRSKGGSVTNAHPTHRATLYLQFARWLTQIGLWVQLGLKVI